MTKILTSEINTETGEKIEREMNAQELTQLAIDKAKAEAENEIASTKAADKAALLAKLGITADEAKLLLQ